MEGPTQGRRRDEQQYSTALSPIWTRSNLGVVEVNSLLNPWPCLLFFDCSCYVFIAVQQAKMPLDFLCICIKKYVPEVYIGAIQAKLLWNYKI